MCVFVCEWIGKWSMHEANFPTIQAETSKHMEKLQLPTMKVADCEAWLSEKTYWNLI